MKLSITLAVILLIQNTAWAENERVEFPVLPASESQQLPDIYGNLVVWQQYVTEYGDYDIFVADINNPGQPLFIGSYESDQTNPAIFEKYIVFQNYFVGQDAQDWDIKLIDISDINEPYIYNVTAIENNDEKNPAIHGNIIVWEDGFSPYRNIYGSDITELDNPREFLIKAVNADQRNPAVYRNTVIWQALNQGGSGQDYFAGNWDIYASDIWQRNKPIEYPVSLVEYDQERTAISETMVVWSDNFFGNWDIYAADISDLEGPQEIPISVNDWDEKNPDIDGNIIVWQALDQSGSGQDNRSG